MRQGRDCGPNRSERCLDDTQDGVENSLEDSQDRAERCGDCVEDASDKISERVDERRHNCYVLRYSQLGLDAEKERAN